MTPQARFAAFAAKIGLTGLAIAILIALLAVQTVRIDGLKVWPFEITGWKARALTAESTIDEIEDAQDDALEKALAAKAKAEQDYRDLAERTDHEAELAQAVAMDAAERFIANNRVRCPADRSSPSGPSPAPGGGSAGSGDGAGGASELDGLVAVPEEDIRICTRNTTRLIAAREWGLALSTQGSE